jgi:ankyrin repeat protein
MELAELLAFDFEARPIPKYHEAWRLEDPVNAVLSTCSSLLAINDWGGYYFGQNGLVEFSHFSVKEFLTSTRLAEERDIILRRYHISMTPAHTLAAQACLGILLHPDMDVITEDSLGGLPLAEYAATYWVVHARLEDVMRKVEVGVKQLFDPDKSHFAVCMPPYAPPVERTPRTEMPLPPCRTPLHYAAFWGLHSIVKFLVIEHTQDVHSPGFIYNETPLHLASEEGHVKISHFLLEHGADVEALTSSGVTPLHLASQKGQLEVAGMLIEHGADVTAQNWRGTTPLHLASQNGQVKVVGMLIEHGADVTAQNKDGWSSLYLASNEGHAEVSSMLIEHGADVTAQGKDGLTLLHLALQNGEAEVAGVLIERGADVTAQNKDGSTPLHLASTYSDPWKMSRQKCAKVTRMLIERGADVIARNKIGETPLHLASWKGYQEVAFILTEHGADVTARNRNGETPLHLASKWGEAGVVGKLVEHGADATAQNKDGKTPLHLVLAPLPWILISPWRYEKIARILLEHGADVTVQDVDGVTPFGLALSGQGAKEIADVLLQHGANPSTHENTN